MLLGSLVTSGGMVAILAFFLPWIAVSCNGNSLGTVSPYDRAVGVEAEPVQLREVDVELPASTGDVPAKPIYWVLLVLPAGLVAVGVAFSLVRSTRARAFGAAATLLAGVGLYTTISLGLGDKLGIDWPDAVAPGVTLRIVLEPGVWLSLAGYALATSGGLAAVLLGRRAQV